MPSESRGAQGGEEREPFRTRLFASEREEERRGEMIDGLGLAMNHALTTNHEEAAV
jgi:hypothetical protein